jgi:hypothetical protein
MKPRRTPRKKPAIPARKKLARPGSPSTSLRVDQVLTARELFWQNVMREMLVSLAGAPSSHPQAQANPDDKTDASGTEPDSTLFDGRLAIITKSGERIPIAAIFPLFAWGVSAPAARDLCLAIECTVFQIRTPDGHVFTIPLHEIRSFHALSPELMEKLERAARRRAARRDTKSDDDAPPFGFAAFTSLARGLPTPPPEPPPAHPME